MNWDEYESKPSKEFLDKFAPLADQFSKIYHGFEAEGESNIPSKGPALIVFYHCFNPLDAWYFGMRHYLKTGRLIRGLGDRWLFTTPGFKQLCEAVGGVPGNPKVARKLLDDGHLVGVAPGGVREAIAGKKYKYQLLWKNRLGFARLALEAKVPIIPGFTENSDEMYQVPLADTNFFRNLYEVTRLPLVPFFGIGLFPFPVKLKAHFGEPIMPESNDTPESLARKTAKAVEDLIKKYQKPNQSVLGAFLDRFRS